MFKKIEYTLKHWLCYQKVAFNLNAWKFKYIFHDIDKVIIILLTQDIELASKIHRKISSHHPDNIFNNFDPESAVIDWECARFTKPDKALSARDTLYKYYPTLEAEILPILSKFKI